jgi:hypothetical protein
MPLQNPELTPCLHPGGGAGGRLREVRGLFVLTFRTLLQHPVRDHAQTSFDVRSGLTAEA